MLSHEKRRGDVTVIIEGELDHSRASRLREEIDALIADERVRRLIFDMRKLQFMDSSGIGMILGRYRIMAARGGRVAVRTGGGRADRLFEMAGLFEVIERLSDKEDKL